MAYPKNYELLSMADREADGARCGLFGTGDPAHPLVFAEEIAAGEFDFDTARPMPRDEAFSILQQINSATNAIN